MELKLPGEGETYEKGNISTPLFFPTTLDKLKRANVLLDTEYEIPATSSETYCLVSIVIHLHGQIPIRICTIKSKVNDANFIVKNVPNNNKISTRLMAPAGLTHIEHHEGDVECPDYNSSLRIIYVSRLRLFLNLQCFPQLHFDETKKEKFLPDYYYNEDKTEYSLEGLNDLEEEPEFDKYIRDPNYCQYFSKKNEYIEKVFSHSSDIKIKDEGLFGIYIDVAIITPNIEQPTSNVKVKSFILSNKSEKFKRDSYEYINELLTEGDVRIKQELEDFIDNGTCKLSTVIEAISSYTKHKQILDGNTNIFFIDLTCSVYTTFSDTPRNIKQIMRPTVSSNELDEINKKRTRHLYSNKNIPQDYPEDFLNEDGTGYDNGCGTLYFDEIERGKLLKSEIAKREYNKIFEILMLKVNELRERGIASGLLHRKKNRTRRRRRHYRRRHTRNQSRTNKRRTRNRNRRRYTHKR
jgi:hypothetical protein